MNLVEILRSCQKEHYLQDIRGACIGPVTAETARQQGIRVELESAIHTIAGLVQAIEHFYKKKEKE
jgi:uroporphyrinogen III methyltransferase/synthase